MKFSENQQEWFYTAVGICIGLLGIGWITLNRIIWDSPVIFGSLGILAGFPTGFFLRKGKIKLYSNYIKIEKTKHKTKQNMK